MTIKLFIKKVSAFSLVGAFTTLLGLFLNFALVKFFLLDPIKVYIVLYAISIFISYWLNIKYTFNGEFSKEGLFYYCLIYLSSALVGIGLMWLMKQYTAIPEYYYIFIVLPFTVIWNFVLSYLKLDKH